MPILHQFWIIRCSRQTALHSALFNYTPLVIRGDWPKYTAYIIKPTQTGNLALTAQQKIHFSHYGIVRAPKKFWIQPCPLLGPSSVNFCQNFLNLSHETVSLIKTFFSVAKKIQGQYTIRSIARLSPDRMGTLGKHPASLALLQSRASSLPCSNPALTKYWRRQNLGVDKKLAQTQKNPLTVWLSRVHSCWLLPDLDEDLLRLPDGDALFACSRQVWHCVWPPCFYGRTFSLTVPAYCIGLPCWKYHKFWRRQNICVCLKFTDFRQTIAVYISAHRRPFKKWWKQKVITITLQYQFLHSWPLN